MDKDAHEPYELEEALAETWYHLQEAHMLLDDTKPTVLFYSERVAEAIAALQAYGHVLRQLEKRAATRDIQ
jgi:hypothetical protein